MTEQQQKLLQEAKDAVAKIIGYKDFAEYHKFWEAKSCIPNQSISEQFMNDVAIKYNELCEADKLKEYEEMPLYDLSVLEKSEKDKMIGGWTSTIGKQAISLYMMFGLKSGIESMMRNDTTNEEFIFSFKKVQPPK